MSFQRAHNVISRGCIINGNFLNNYFFANDDVFVINPLNTDKLNAIMHHGWEQNGNIEKIVNVMTSVYIL